MIKNIMTLFVILIIAILAGALYLNANKRNLIEKGMENMLESITGVDVELKGVSVLDNGKRILVDEIIIYNTPRFEGKILARVTNVSMVLNPWALFEGKILIDQLKFTLNQVYIEKNPEMQLNLSELTAVSDAVLEKGPPARGTFFIGRMEIVYGDVIFAQLSTKKEEKPAVLEMNFKSQREIYDRVRDINALVQIPVVKLIEAFNQGTMGIRRGKILENIRQSTGLAA